MTGMAGTTSKDSIGTLIRASKYKIPFYQREYAWRDKQVKDLLRDLENLYDANRDEHYMGTVVLLDEEDRYREVVDGQQRLTTLTILFAAVRDELYRIRSEVDNEASRDSIDNFIGATEELIVDRNQNLKIHHNDEHREIFEHIVHHQSYDDFDHEDENPSKSDCENISEAGMVRARSLIDWWLSDKRSSFEDKEDNQWNYKFARFLDDFRSHTCDSVKVTRSMFEDSEQAARSFGTLNDRGRDLNQANKMKSHLALRMSLIQDDEVDVEEDSFKTDVRFKDSRTVRGVFSDMLSKVAGVDGGRDDIDRFMKEHFRCFSGEIRFEGEIKRHVERSDGHISPQSSEQNQVIKWADSYLRSLDRHMDFYKFFREPYTLVNDSDAEIANSSDNLTKKLYAICQYAPTQAIHSYLSSLMVAYEYADDDDIQSEIEKAADTLESLVIWGYSLSGKRNDFCRALIRQYSYDIEWHVAEREPTEVFSGAIQLRTDSLESAVKESREELATKLESELTSIEQPLTNKDIFDGSYTSGWTGISRQVGRYILCEYENSLSQYEQIGVERLHKIQEQDDPSTEHILPRNPDTENYSWSDYNVASEEEHSEYVNQLGNLVVLPMDSNIQCSNLPYAEKRKHYQNLNLTSISEVCSNRSDWEEDTDCTVWEKSDIESRTEHIAEFAEERWKPDYS
jgi:hypothetical protein